MRHFPLPNSIARYKEISRNLGRITRKKMKEEKRDFMKIS